MAKSKALSRELRHGGGEHLERRRKMVVLALTSIGSMGLIALYQMGVISHLPEPPLPYLDADKVDGTAEAYARLQTPDAAVGLVSYATTLALIAPGGRDRARTDPLDSAPVGGEGHYRRAPGRQALGGPMGQAPGVLFLVPAGLRRDLRDAPPGAARSARRPPAKLARPGDRDRCRGPRARTYFDPGPRPFPLVTLAAR